jgi:hypothetical protein
MMPAHCGVLRKIQHFHHVFHLLGITKETVEAAISCETIQIILSTTSRLDEGAVLEIPSIVFYLVPGVAGSSVVLRTLMSK